MPPILSVDDAPATPAVVCTVRPRTRRRFWGLLAAALLIGALASSPLWHVVLRGALTREAARRGYELTLGRISGSPFGTIYVHGLRCRQSACGINVRASRAEVTLSWTAPVVRRVALSGINGRWNLVSLPTAARVQSRGIGLPRAWLAWSFPRLIPGEISVETDDLTLSRRLYDARLRGLRLSVAHNTTGLFFAREVEIAGPGFKNTLLNRHGQTAWQGNRFTLEDVEFGPGVRLVNATLDGTQLDRQRLDWAGNLSVMGGEIRGQGAVNFVHPRLALEIGGSLRRVPVSPLARLLGLVGPAGGTVEQGSFSFRGDPEDPASAQMWLAAQATDFRWRQRDWQSLDLRATVLHRRIEVRRLELQQSRNRLSLTGDCPLPNASELAGRWWEAGFAVDVDARLEDLHDLTQLFGERLPDLDGRMSLNGTLEAVPGQPGIHGYLNVEGSRLRIRGTPVDYLRSTLLFRGDELNVADLQATHGEDYVGGQGSVSLAGAFQYHGEIRLALSDPGEYAQVLAGLLEPMSPARYPLRLEGVFCGPATAGNAAFLPCDDLLEFPVPPTIFY